METNSSTAIVRRWMDETDQDVMRIARETVARAYREGIDHAHTLYAPDTPMPDRFAYAVTCAADALREWIEWVVGESHESGTFSADLITNALAQVDWQEIARALLGEED